MIEKLAALKRGSTPEVSEKSPKKVTNKKRETSAPKSKSAPRPNSSQRQRQLSEGKSSSSAPKTTERKSRSPKASGSRPTSPKANKAGLKEVKAIESARTPERTLSPASRGTESNESTSLETSSQKRLSKSKEGIYFNMANVKPKPKPEENTTKVEEEQEIQDDWSLNGLTDLKGMDLNPLTRTSITFTGENRVGVKPIDSTSFQNRFLYEAIGIHPEDDPENVLPDRPDPGGDYKPGNFPSVKSILSASSFSKDKDLSRKASTNSNSFVVSEAPKKKVEEKRSVSEPSPKKKPIPPAPPQVKPKAAPRAAVEKKSVPAKKKTAGVKRYASTGGKKGGVSPSKGAPKRQVDQMDIFDAIYDEFVSSDSEAGSAASSIVSIPADFLDILYSGNEASSPPPPTESTGASSSSSPVVIAREADPPSPADPHGGRYVYEHILSPQPDFYGLCDDGDSTAEREKRSKKKVDYGKLIKKEFKKYKTVKVSKQLEKMFSTIEESDDDDDD